MDDISSDAEIMKLAFLFGVMEDSFYYVKAENSAVLIKAVLDCIYGLILEMLYCILLRKDVQAYEVVYVLIKPLTKIGLKSLDFSGARQCFEMKYDWSLIDQS